MLIDTHCHLEEHENLGELLKEIFDTDVKIIIVSGYDVESSKFVVALAEKYNNVYATVGFHPNDCKSIEESDYSYFDEWLKSKKVVGIGEIGLDYHYGVDNKNEQIERFKRQIEIAEKHNKPIVVHNRDASNDIYDILKQCKVKGIIHCFNDDINMANKFIDLGFVLGIGGILTFKKNNLREVINQIDLHSIVLETDAPYLAPEPLRGTQNSPINIPIIADELAKTKGITYNEVVSVTTANAFSIFDFNLKI